MRRSSTHRNRSTSGSSRTKLYHRRKRLLAIEPLETRRLLAGAGAPFVLAITRLDSSPSNRAQIRYQVVFDEAVTGVNATDFAITRTGGISGYSIASITGSGTTYVANVNTGTSNGTLRLDLIDNDSIRDLSGTRLGGTGSNNGNFTTGQVYTIDKTAPTATLTKIDASPSAATSLRFAATFSESVTGVDAADFGLVLSGVSGASISNIAGSGSNYTVTINSGSNDGSIQLQLNDNDSIVDLASNTLGGTGTGNGNALSDSYSIDKTKPTVASVTRLDSNPTNASSVRFQVDFSEAVSGVETLDFLAIPSGSLSGVVVSSVTGSGSGYVVTVDTGFGDGDLGLGLSPAVTIVDSATNAMLSVASFGVVYRVDRTSPNLVQISRLDSSPTNAFSTRYAVSFDEPVTGLDAADFFVPSTGTLAGVSITSLTGSGASYVVTIGNGSGDGDLRLELASSRSVWDLAGNLIAMPTFSVVPYTIDHTLPQVASVGFYGDSPTSANLVSFQVNFSEPVQSITTADFSLVTAGIVGASINAVTALSSSSFQVDVQTGTGDGSISIDVLSENQIIDLAGNQMAAPARNNASFLIDKTRPSVILSLLDSSLTQMENLRFGVAFSEAVTGVDLTDFEVLTNPTLATTFQLTRLSGSNFEIIVNVGVWNGTAQIRLNDDDSIVDAVGLSLGGIGIGNGTVTSDAYTVDQRPTLDAISLASPIYTNATAVVFNLRFSEPVTDVGPEDLQVNAVGISSAAISSITGSGDTRQVTVNTGTGNGTLSLGSVGDSIFDLIGQRMLPTTLVSSEYVVDKIAPVILSFSQLDTTITNAATVRYQVLFSESVYGVNASDFQLVSSGTLTGTSIQSVTGSDNSYVVTLTTGTGEGSLWIEWSVSAIAIDQVNNAVLPPAVTAVPYVLDRTAPKLTSITPLDSIYNNTATVRYRAVFNEPVFDVGIDDFLLYMGSGLSAASISSVSGSGTTYDFSIETGVGDGQLQLVVAPTVSILDIVGLPFTLPTLDAPSYYMDRTAPAVLAVLQSDTAITNSNQVKYRVQFSEPVFNFDASDIGIVSTGIVGARVASLTPITGTDWFVNLETGTGSGTLNVAVLFDNLISDRAGNAMALGATGNNDYTIDKTFPTALINLPNITPTDASTVRFNLQFSESVVGLGLADFELVVTGTVVGMSSALTGSGSSYSLDVNRTGGDGTIAIRLLDDGTVFDLVGNPLGGPSLGDGIITSDSYSVFDFPVVRSIAPVSTSPTHPSFVTNASIVSFTVRFSEEVLGGTVADFETDPIGLSSTSIVSVSGTGATRQVFVNTGVGNGTLGLKVIQSSITDLFGHPLKLPAPPATNRFTIDRNSPVVTVFASSEFDEKGVVASGTTRIGVEFSEPILGAGDFANYELRRAGTDRLLLSSDSVVNPVSVQVSGSTATLLLSQPLVSDSYRLVIKETITDLAGNPLDGNGDLIPGGHWVRDFVVDDLINPNLQFHGNGINRETMSSFSGYYSFAYAVAVQPDGKYVVAGYHFSGCLGLSDDFGLARFHADGTLDKSFDADGRVAPIFGTSYDYGLDIAIQGDGKILIVGQTQNGSNVDFGVARLNPDGTLDSSFDNDGLVVHSLESGSDTGWSIALQVDGRILVAGRATPATSSQGFGMARLLTDGALDTSFDADGKVFTTFAGTSSSSARRVLPLPDGKILVAGSAVSSTDNDFAIARYNWDGTLDYTFDFDGRLTIPMGTSNDYLESIAVRPDGRVLLSGSVWNGVNYDMGVVSLNKNGSLDSSFGSGGKRTFSLSGGNDIPSASNLLPTGELVLTGSARGTTNIDFAAVRLLPNGDFDSQFGNNGVSIFPVGIDTDQSLGATVQNDGRIVMVGFSSLAGTRSFTVARLNANGTLDTSFSSDGLTAVSVSGANDFIRSMTLQADGNAIAVGGITNATSTLMSISRYTTAGSLDPSFGGTGNVSLTYLNAPNTVNSQAEGVAVQPDGKIVVVGSTVNTAGNTDHAVVRFLPDGSLDPSFDGDGKVQTPVSTGGSLADNAKAVSILPSGKILVLGSVVMANGFTLALTRYNSDGSLDTSLGGTGTLLTQMADTAVDMVVRPNGSIVIAGTRTIMMLTSSGSLDLSFNRTGFVSLPSAISSMSVQADGKILVSGFQSGVFVRRYLVNGLLDTSFDGDGIATVVVPNQASRTAIAIAPDGKILVSGQRLYSGPNFEYAGFFGIRLNGNGSIDTTFGELGLWLPTSISGNGGANKVVIAPDGSLLIAGTVTSSTDEDFGVISLSSVGTSAVLQLPTLGQVSIDMSPNGYGQLIQGPSNAFDGWNRLEVNGTPLSTKVGGGGNLTNDGQTWTSDPMKFSNGIKASRQIYSPKSGDVNFVRFLDFYRNETLNSLTSDLRYVGNLGSDASTTVFATSDGDSIIESTDWWYGTDDADGSGTPATIHLMHGKYGLQPSVSLWEDNLEWSYGLTLEPGQTKQVLSYTVFGATRQSALDAVSSLVSNAGLTTASLANMSSADALSIANFRFEEAPTGVSISSSQIAELSPVGTLVGLLRSTDGNLADGDSFSYTLVSGAGDTSNASFSIIGNELRTETVLDYESLASHTVRIRTTDSTGNSFEQIIRLNVVDVPNEAPPKVVTTSFSERGTMGNDSNRISISFDRPLIGSGTAANFALRRAGNDGLLLQSDDVISPISVNVVGSTVVLSYAELPEDTYRMTISPSIADSLGLALDGDEDGLAGGNWQRDFVVTRNRMQLISEPGLPFAKGEAGLSSARTSSSDGRYVVFSSSRSDLVPGDTNGVKDVFRFDRQTGVVVRVSTTTTGTPNERDAINPSINSDGRYVTFQSDSWELVRAPNDLSTPVYLQRIFVKDLQTGTLTLVSTSSAGVRANGHSLDPSISGNGVLITFSSISNNLVVNITPGVSHVFVKNWQTGAITLGSITNLNSEPTGNSTKPVISENGIYIAYQSVAPNILGGDEGNLNSDIYVRSIRTGISQRVSISSLSGNPNGESFRPSISNDGRWIAFHSTSSNLVAGDTNGKADVFVRSMETGAVTRLSVGDVGLQADGNSLNVSLSLDGSVVAFESDATNLSSNDDNNKRDVFVRRTVANSNIKRISAFDSGSNFEGDSLNPSITGDGRYVLFTSSNLQLAQLSDVYIADSQSSQIDMLLDASVATPSTWTGSSSVPQVTGGFLVHTTTGLDGVSRVYRKDIVTGLQSLVVENARSASISSDGNTVVFVSTESNLVSDDLNQSSDVFAKNIATGVVTRVSIADSGAEAMGASDNPTLTPDGRFVSFWTSASNLLPSGETNGVVVKDLASGAHSVVLVGDDAIQGISQWRLSGNGRFMVFVRAMPSTTSIPIKQVFVKDLETGTETVESVNMTGGQPSADSLAPSINSDGRYVVFSSRAADIALNSNGFMHVYLRDRIQQTTTVVSQSTSGDLALQDSDNQSISGDGRLIAFVSSASNLVNGDGNGASDIFVRDVIAGTTSAVSRGSGDALGDGASRAPIISEDGQSVVFLSDASNLIAGDHNQAPDAFVVRLQDIASVLFTGGNGQTIAIDGNGRSSGQLIRGTPVHPGAPSALDAANRLQIDGVEFSTFGGGMIVDNGDGYVTSVGAFSGLDVTRRVNILDTLGHSFVRSVESFFNPTSSTVTATIRMIANASSDDETSVFNTSDGDTMIETTDWWMGTDDMDGNGASAVVHLVHGPEGLNPTSITLVEDNLHWSYQISIAPGETKRLASFSFTGLTRVAAMTDVESIMARSGFIGNATLHMTQAELDSIANFQFNDAATVELTDAMGSIAENTEMSVRIKVADILIVDDGYGTNVVSLAGPDATAFEIDGSSLYLRSGIVLNFEAKNSFSVTVHVDDTSIAGDPDNVVQHVLNVADINELVTLTSQDVSLTGEVQTLLSNSGTWNDPESGDVELTATLGEVVKSANGTWNWSYSPNEVVANQVVTITANDGVNVSSVTFTINAVAVTPTLTITSGDRTYDRTAYAAVAMLSGSATPTPAITFAYFSDSDGTLPIAAPVNAGKYYVRASVAANLNNNAAQSALTAFTIQRVALVATVTVNDKPFDNTTAATITARSLSGVIGPDAVTLSGGVATFADIGVGNNKTVAVSGLVLSGADVGNYTVNTTATTFASITATVFNRQVFYNNSGFEIGIGGSVNAALDSARVLLQSSGIAQTTTPANVSNYSQGLNGVVLDIAGLAASTLTADDFILRVAPPNASGVVNPSSWPSAPATSAIVVQPGGSASIPSRVQLEWADVAGAPAIQNRWLQIIVKANANTGLTTPQTFYIGHAMADVDRATPYRVTASDLSQVRARVSNTTFVSINEDRDVNKDGRITALDLSFVRARVSNTAILLNSITIPAAGSSAEGSAGAAGGNGGGGGAGGNGDGSGGGIDDSTLDGLAMMGAPGIGGASFNVWSSRTLKEVLQSQSLPRLPHESSGTSLQGSRSQFNENRLINLGLTGCESMADSSSKLDVSLNDDIFTKFDLRDWM